MITLAYFLKQTTLKGRTYLAIYESFYSAEKKGTAHRSYKSLGSIETLTKNGMLDPVNFYQKEVDALNAAKKEEGIKKISHVSPLLYLGYFPLKSILEKMKIKKYVDLFQLTNAFEFDLYEVMSTLIYARSVHPCSKLKTFHDVLPQLYTKPNYSYHQLLHALAFMGNNYEKFVELFTAQTASIYKMDTSKTYFDCTNFYFEIDREDDFKKNGPSKENQKAPIVGLGLLLDAHQIPIGMKMYPGNQSEKPVLRQVISQLKAQNNISGKTIHVADKGLNCADNIATATLNGDGYLFSKSVKQLPKTEKVWVLLPQDYTEIYDANGKHLYSAKSCIDEFAYTITTADGKRKQVLLKEKRLVTFNPKLAKKKQYEIQKMIEKAKRLSHSQAKKKEYGEASKYVNFQGNDGEKSHVVLNEDAIKKDLELAGYNMLVTSETLMSDQDMYDTYHNLWRIEESFRIMKSDLDARPVFLQNTDSIQGHFLLCYLTVLLERILQFKVLDNQYPASQLFKFFKNFRVVKAENKYINTTTSNPCIEGLTQFSQLPLTNYFLSKTQIKSILNFKVNILP